MRRTWLRRCRLRICPAGRAGSGCWTSRARSVAEAEVTVGGGGRSRTNENGYAEITLPAPNWYALVIKYPGHEEVLYMEQLEPDRTYVYRADSMTKERSLAGGEVGSIGNVLLQE